MKEKLMDLLKEEAGAGRRVVIITRHPALVDYLHEQFGDLLNGAEVKEHASPKDVEGAIVFGVLPLHLAALAHLVVNVPLRLPPELRGQELSLAQVREFAGEPKAYRVEEVA